MKTIFAHALFLVVFICSVSGEEIFADHFEKLEKTWTALGGSEVEIQTEVELGQTVSYVRLKGSTDSYPS
jgi:hypothetical protein